MWQLVACTPPGGKQDIPQVKLTIQNTLPIRRENVSIALSLAELRGIAPDFSFDAYLVVSGNPPREIPSQADDTNYNGRRDELLFLVDLAPNETKEISIRYSPKNQMPVTLGFTRRTRAGIFPELSAYAALESERIAYALKPDGGIDAYGKTPEVLFSLERVFQGDLDFSQRLAPNLRQAFDKNGWPLSQNATAEVRKQGSRWVITDAEQRRRFSIVKGAEGLDVLRSAGLLLHQLADQSAYERSSLLMSPDEFAFGRVALWDAVKQKTIPFGDAGAHVRILADGPVRSVVQRIIPDLALSAVARISLTSTVSIHGGGQWCEHRLRIQGLPDRYRVAIGAGNGSGAVRSNETEGWVSAWVGGNATHQDGFGLIYPTAQFDSFKRSSRGENLLLLEPGETGEVAYQFAAVWDKGEIGIETREMFEQYVQVTAKANLTPPIVAFEQKASETKDEVKSDE